MKLRQEPFCLFTLAFLVMGMTWPSKSLADFSFSAGNQVHIQADTIEYLKDQNLVVAKGQVHIQQGTVHLYADNVRYDAIAQDLQATGHVVWQDEQQEVEAETLTYNLQKKEGKAYKIKSTTPPWISYGDEVQILEKKTVIRHAVTTTCDYPPGYRHYSLVADKITIYSDDYLVAENVVMYIGKVPVFYFPFFVKTVHELRSPFSFSTGSTEYLGNYVLLTTNYLFSPVNYGALYTDYFIKQGFGLGLRHEIALNDYSVLSLYGYGVPDDDSGKFRWEGRVRGLWAVSSTLLGRVEADVPGDGFFSQDYFVARRDPSLVSTVRDYNISATFTRPQFTLGLLFRRQELADTTLRPGDRFTRNLENLPQATFTLFPRPLIGNWLKYDLNAQGEHSYTLANNYFVNRFSGELGISQNLLFAGTQNVYSRLSVRELYQDVADKGLTNKGETRSLTLSNTWTGRWSWFASTTFSHILSKKLNGLTPSDPRDGVLSNQLSGALEVTAGSAVRARTSLSYDFAAPIGTVASHFSFLRQEVSWTPSLQFSGTVIADYSIKANALKDVNAVLNFTSSHDQWRARLWGNFVDPNIANTGYVTIGLAPTFLVGGEVAFTLFTNYRLALLESYNLAKSRFETRSVSLYRDLHDWEAEMNYAEDPIQGKRFSFKLNLKVFSGRPLGVSQEQLQRLDGLRNQGLTGAAGQFN